MNCLSQVMSLVPHGGQSEVLCNPIRGRVFAHRNGELARSSGISKYGCRMRRMEFHLEIGRKWDGPAGRWEHHCCACDWRALHAPGRDSDRHFVKKNPVRCAQVVLTDSESTTSECLASSERGLFQIAGLIGAATLVSKVIGLAREAALAAVYGVGPVMNAFNYASIVPGFFLTMLGGINGPFHSAMTAALSKRRKEDGQKLLTSVSLLSGLACTGFSILIFLNAGLLIDTLAPGLLVAADGILTRRIAIIQLKMMAPCALLAALIGLGFGTLSANGIFGIPSLSPALSSISILAAVALHVSIFSHLNATPAQQALAGGISLAIGSTCGAFLQWGVQVFAQQKVGIHGLHLSWINPFKETGIYEVLAVMVPAALNSGMTQVATFTDLHFASYIPGAAAALGYANLLVMAPLGILSSPVLLSLLPIYSRLTRDEQRPALRDCVQQGLLLSMALTLSLTAVMIPLARPTVRFAFQRRTFDASATSMVSSLLTCYVSGSTFYLMRDVLVQVFYALGDGRTPLYITLAGVVANGIFDWLLVRCSGFGAAGLVIATMTVNFASAGLLLSILSKRLEGFRMAWHPPLLVLMGCGIYTAVVTEAAYDQIFLLLSSFINSGMSNFLALGLATSFGFASFFAPLLLFRSSEISWAMQLLQMKSKT
ncbi:uncharacterized protein [Physcomitrium patens]|uniref:Lipid II flippase MurJ n=1 Tax=Physcomitrium patens TaxID=3218 RepID=A0A7I4C6R1_PHYPA|nr:uncharacterized protein LOC112274324 isoform X2 [Physcomitrium patens]|eukprot:XP_024359491.1 uncharacterized protein LOC112274324 isoform X2 [Physcomitrella patens]